MQPLYDDAEATRLVGELSDVTVTLEDKWLWDAGRDSETHGRPLRTSTDTATQRGRTELTDDDDDDDDLGVLQLSVPPTVAFLVLYR